MFLGEIEYIINELKSKKGILQRKITCDWCPQVHRQEKIKGQNWNSRC